MARYKMEIVKTKIMDALDAFYSDINDLREEIQEVVDGAEGGRAETQRIQTLGESAETLDIERPDLGGDAEAMIEAESTDVGISMRGGKKRGVESRQVRCDNAASHGRAAADYILELVEHLRQEDDEKADDAADKLSDDDQAKLEELEDFANQVLEHVEQVEGAEFPGMMG